MGWGIKSRAGTKTVQTYFYLYEEIKNELHPIIEKISPNDMTTIWNRNSGHLIVIQQKTGNTQICQENNNM